MSHVIYNGELISEDGFHAGIENRALNYGDGLFETMIIRSGTLRFAGDHMARLHHGLKVLSIQLSMDNESLIRYIHQLAAANNLQDNARIKLQVWRRPGGLVTPQSAEAEYLIRSEVLKEAPEIKDTLIISENIKLSETIYSGCKTLNFLPYILAALEKKNKGADEILITDLYGNISEASSSNIFWIKNEKIYTPALKSGCIDGIMRKQIFRIAAENKLYIEEGLYPISDLKGASVIFTSNVTGLSLIRNFLGNDYELNSPVFQTLKDLVFSLES